MRKKVKETDGIIIETHKYYGSDTKRIMSKINKEISSYRVLYGVNPQFMVISRELATIFDIELSLMAQRQMIMTPTNDYLELHSVFGIPCLVSKVLSGLQFEVR
jgi:hypothetical protein